MNSTWKAAALAALVLLSSKPAVAAPIPIASLPGLEALGSFTGTIDYDPIAFLLEISLTNTSPAANGGFITAFAFNNPGNLITDATLVSTDADFGVIGGAGADNFQNDISVEPFGAADIGASVTSAWLGGGSPNPGIGVGNSATFAFSLAGTGLGALTEANFFSALSTGGGQDPEWLLVRFRGFKDGGSDKVGTGVPEPPTVTAVPEPASLLLFGIAAVLAARRVRTRA